MFGKNPIRKQEPEERGWLWVQEVFYTVQGEGPFAGEPSVFVRLGGCNLRCYWCDTEFESSDYRPTYQELIERVEEIRPPTCDLVVLTGGEPFRQALGPFVERLLDAGLRVQIETNGTLWIDLPEHPRLTIVCSPKTGKLHPSLVPRISAYKYVIAANEVDPEDGLPIASTQAEGVRCRIARPQPGIPIYVMPRDDHDADRSAANAQVCLDVAMNYGYRLTLQIHKTLGLP